VKPKLLIFANIAKNKTKQKQKQTKRKIEKDEKLLSKKWQTTQSTICP
jgi:hypothetical protein